jgi:protein involved in polysaccharide export with SLBB domain
MKLGAALCVLILLGGSLRAQQGDGAGPARQASNTAAGLGASAAEANRNIMLARSSADYRVTPGDVYTLAYAAGSAAVTYVITVDSTYRIRVSNLGVINGAGKTFVQVKGEAEAAVMNNYPLSGVQLVLTQPAVFLVKVKGEVHSAGEAEAWGLSRLSSLARDEAGAAGGRSAVRPTAYASLRDVAVRSQSGQVRVYDLFRAERYGDLTQDPHLRPGDEITFGRAERTVWISGEVERPGSYQLLAGENLRELAGVPRAGSPSHVGG